MEFQGFSPETEQFFWGIRLNNERSWFLAHKQDYLRYAYEPLKALASQVQQRFLERNPDLMLNVSVSRIYRDVRVVKDGRPYKDHLWLSLFPPHDEYTPYASFYVGLEATGYCYGVGYYWNPPQMMELFRQRALECPGVLEALTRRLEERPAYRIGGEEYKRSKGDCPALVKPWFNRKTLDVFCERSYEEGSCYSAAFVDEVVEAFEWLLPFYEEFRRLDEAYLSRRNV